MTRGSPHPLVFNYTTHPHEVNLITVVIAVAITVYFWRLNIIGIHESSDKALRIMQATTVMGVIVIGWSLLTLLMRHLNGGRPLSLPPLHPVFTQTSLDPEKESSAGWLEQFPAILGSLGILAAFGHSLLAMSGEESLAQVNREIEAPKLKNLIRTGLVICIFSILLTGLISVLAVLIIPDGKRVQTQVVNNGTAVNDDTRNVSWTEVDFLRLDDQHRLWGYAIERSRSPRGDSVHTTARQVFVRPQQHVERDDGGYRDNLINGLVNFLYGPGWLKIIVESLVVVVGFLILAGAVNTSIIGSNGVLNRLAEDGVLTRWFQQPQPKYGTTHRLINVVGIMQVLVLIASRGNVNMLGEAYAFGVIWSFVFMTLAMAVLRFKDRSPRQYETPVNIAVGRPDGRTLRVPVGILAVFLILISTALINLATKKTATIWGIAFTVVFLMTFTIMEYITRRLSGGKQQHLEQFNEQSSDKLTPATAGVTLPHPIVVAARGPNSLPMLGKILRETDTTTRDVVVLTCKVLPHLTIGVTEAETEMSQEERDLLTKVVTIAEDIGKQVKPVVLPTNNPLYAIARAARDLKATEVVLGVSEKIHAEEQLEQFALAWGSTLADLIGAAPLLTVRVIGPQVEMKMDLD